MSIEQMSVFGIISVVGIFLLGRIQGSKSYSQSTKLVDESMQQLPVELKEEIKGLVCSGNKIQAIKKLRQVANTGLKESKDIVEAIANEAL